MNVREWRIKMQKALLDVEEVEQNKAGWKAIPDPIRSQIINLTRDLTNNTKEK